jgi:hypothetical protein
MKDSEYSKMGINKKALSKLVLARLIEGLNKEFGSDYKFDEAHAKAAGVYVIIAEAIIDHIMEYGVVRPVPIYTRDEHGNKMGTPGKRDPETGEEGPQEVMRLT